ncbi:MAG: hypothetical protein E7572_05125 [Ruminococcaceae bacterium]|nr:hypothetical protein [Oscillospiraceae bacterium]
MTLINALEELKANGVTRLVGMAGITDIDTYIEHATENHKNAVTYAAKGIQTWQYELDHEDDSYIVDMADGHHIIATHYGTFDMATYSDYETEEEMNTAFDAWEIAQQAAEIADEKVKQGSSLPREAWILVATAELTAVRNAAAAEFERTYCKKQLQSVQRAQ